MASLICRQGRWRALVRRKGFRPLCKTFDTQKEAAAWGEIEEKRIKLLLSGKTPNPAADAVPYQVPGVYMLFLGSELQYVGRSVHIYRRLNDHNRASMLWDRFKIIPCADSVKAADMEQSLIAKHKPPFNLKAEFRRKGRKLRNSDQESAAD